MEEAAIPLGRLSQSEFEMARQRRVVGMQRSLRTVADELTLSEDEPPIDFTAAGLYLVGLQAALATVACAAVAIACCWLLPASAISAVRTLAVTTAVGLLLIRSPWRLGRVRGVTTMFNALRPCVPLYIAVLVIEQLVHTCVSPDRAGGGAWRRVVYHVMVVAMVASGFARAHRPRSETDLPFLCTCASLLLIALLPPSAVVLSGPLCEPAALFTAGERLLRALLFSSLYVVHVYCAAPGRNAMNELAVCVMRCAAAAVWVLGCHALLLVLAPPQAVLALWARFGSEEPAGSPAYNQVDTRSEGSIDAEIGALPGIGPNGVFVAPTGLYGVEAHSNGAASPSESRIEILQPKGPPCGASDYGGVPVDASALARMAQPLRADIGAPPRGPPRSAPPALSFSLGGVQAPSSTMSQERMAEIASQI
jgi:hypothetical protein